MIRRRYPKPRPGRQRRRPAEVQTITINQKVWQVAMDLAAGDVRRLIRIDGETVLVVNQPRRK